MGLRWRYRLSVAVLGAGHLGLTFVLTRRAWALWPLLGLWATCAAAMTRLRCPRCTKHVLSATLAVGPLRIPVTWPGVPAHCRQCGLPLT